MNLLDAQTARREVPDSPVTLEFRVIACQKNSVIYRSGSGLLLVAEQGRLLGATGAVVSGDVDEVVQLHRLDCELLADEAAYRTLQDDFDFERARIFTLRGVWTKPRLSVEGLTIRPLEPTDSIEHLPAELRAEIAGARDKCGVMAGFIERQAVSFAYALTTESLADLSIDTLAQFRDRGIGRAVAAALVDGLVDGGKTPVWGAVESNFASLRLATVLGFTRPAGELFLAEL